MRCSHDKSATGAARSSMISGDGNGQRAMQENMRGSIKSSMDGAGQRALLDAFRSSGIQCTAADKAAEGKAGRSSVQQQQQQRWQVQGDDVDMVTEGVPSASAELPHPTL